MSHHYRWLASVAAGVALLGDVRPARAQCPPVLAASSLAARVPAMAALLRARNDVESPTRPEASPVVGDTVCVRLAALEARLDGQNLQLLAARLTVGAARAAVEQARLRRNPSLTVEQNAFNRITGAVFDYTRTGNTELSLQQVVPVAGKRTHQIALAVANADVAAFQYGDTLRTLRYRLRSSFFDLYFLRRALAADAQLLGIVQRAVSAAERLYASRAILLSEVVRLRALLLAVESERLDDLGQIAEVQGGLRVLLGDVAPGAPEYVPDVDARRLDSLRVDTVSLPAALARAGQTRAGVRLADAALRAEVANLSLQRAQRVPDVSVGARYARAGSYTREYVALTFGVDVPLFNRNQGNVRTAEYTVTANQRLATAARGRVAQEVVTAYRKAVAADSLYRDTDARRLVDEFDRVLAGISADYERRNVGIIPFTNIVDAYRQAAHQIIQIQRTRVNAMETLNYTVGASVVQP